MKCTINKKSIFAAILLVCALLVGCGASKEAPVSNADSSDWHDMQYSCSGTRVNYSEGYTINDLLSLDFSFSIIDIVRSQKSLKPGEHERYILRTSDGHDAFYVRVNNTTSKKMSVKKCEISDIVAIVNSDPNYSTNIELGNGVCVGLASDEVKDRMGEPDEIFDKNEKIRWTYYVDETKTKKIVIQIVDDAVNMINLHYFD